jgi:hypothetical protein
MNVLEILRQVCIRIGLPRPASGVSSNDPQILQLVGQLNKLPEDFMTRKAFLVNTQEAVWLSTGVVDQGPLDTIAPLGYMGLMSGTLRNRAGNIELGGPVDGPDWQRHRTAVGSNPFGTYRILRGHLYLDSPPLAGATCAFEYYSSFFVVEHTDGTLKPKQYITRDDDTFLVNDALPISWLEWRWKSVKGLDYAEDFASYERLLNTYLIRQGDSRVVNLCAPRYGSILEVPQGSWRP